MLGVLVIVGKETLDECGSLVGGPVYDKRVKIVRRWQQTPDVEVCPPGERGVANQLRFWITAATEIRGDEPIDRCPPISPDNLGYRGTLERERRFPLWPRRG